MLTVTCPNCGIQLSLEEIWLGKHVECGGCHNGFLLSANLESKAQSSSVEDSSPIPYDPMPLYKRKRHRKSFLVRAISLTIHFSITCGTLYLGYRMIQSRKTPQPKPVVVRQEQRPQRPMRTKPRPRPERRQEKITQPAAVAPTVIPKKVAPFQNAPTSVALTPIEDKAAQILAANLTDTEFRFSTNDQSLTHTKKVLLWQGEENEKPTTVAGLAIIDDALQFIWVGEVSKDAAAAVTNSVVFLKERGAEHAIALRNPKVVEPFSFNLKKPVQRILCRCELLSPLGEIYFEFTGIAKLPLHNLTGVDPHKLKLRDELVIRYQGAQNAKTTVTIKRKGNIIVAELSSLYMLPSGDIEPISIPAGNQKRRELLEIEEEANWSKANLGKMKSSLSSAQSQYRRIQGTNAGLNTAAAAAKQQALNQLDAEIRRLNKAINRADQLIKDLPAIRSEIAELNRIAAVARELHETKGIGYRFYIVVDGVEVDLVVAKP